MEIYLLRTFLAFTLVVLFAAVALSQIEQDSKVTVENRTSSLKVLAVEEDSPKSGKQRQFNYSLQNNYDKTVATVLLEVKNETTGKSFFIIDHGLTRALKPGGILRGLFIKSANEDCTLRILAVIFSNGSAEGDPAAAKQLQELAWGQALAYLAIIPLWQDFLKDSKAIETLAGIQSFRKTLDQFPTYTSSSKEINRGFDNGKGSAASTVFRLERSLINGEDPDIPGVLTQKLSAMERYVAERKEVLSKLFEASAATNLPLQTGRPAERPGLKP